MAENDTVETEANGPEETDTKAPETDAQKVDETPETDGPEEGDDKTDWTPPTKDETERMKATLAARKADVNRLKAELKAAKAEKDEPDPDLRLKRSATRGALEGAGLTKDGAKDALKILNLDVLELDEDGDVDAADVLDLIRTAFAPLFKQASKTAPNRTLSAKKPTKTDDGQKTSAKRLLESAGF